MTRLRLYLLFLAGSLLISLPTSAQFISFSPTGGCNSGNVYSVYMKDANTAYFATDNCVDATTNAGDSFTNVGTGINTPSDFSWANADTAYYANGDRILCTYNGGASWSDFKHGNSGVAADIHAFSGLHFIYVSSDGTIFETTDGGINYTMPNSHTISNLNSLHFVDSNIGFACGDDGVIIKTNDGGQSWGKLKSGTVEILTYIWFIDKNTGFVVGDVGTLLKTTNGGSTWTAINSLVTTPLNCIKNAGNSNTTIYACGDAGVLLKSVDAGDNWSVVNLKKVSDILEKLYFSDSNNGFCVGLNYTLLKMNPCPTAAFKHDLDTVCKGGTISFTNQSSGSNSIFSWRANGVEFATTQDVQQVFNDTGTFNITLYAKSNVKQCDDSISHTVTILNIPEKPTISGLHTLCQGGSLPLTSSSPTNNQWTNGNNTDLINQSGQVFVATTTGTYKVKVWSGRSCFTLSDPVTITTVAAKPSLAFTTQVANGDISFTNTTTAGDWYAWYISDVGNNTNYKLISNFSTPATYTPTQGKGTYSIKLVGVNGCGADSITQLVNTNTGISGAAMQEAFELYPNPASSALTVKNTLPEKTTITIYDMAGKTILAHTLNANSTQTLATEQLEKGIYFISLQSGNNLVLQKLVKE